MGNVDDHPDETLGRVLHRLLELRERIPAELSAPLPAESTWLVDAHHDERLCWALEQAGAIFVELDPEARITYASPNAEAITGYKPSEVLGLQIGDRVHPDDIARFVEVALARGEGTLPDRTRLRLRHKRGGWVHLEAVSAARFRARDGQIHSVSVLCDVTARQEAWEALRESEERHRVIVDASRSAVIEIDETARTTYVSKEARETFGYSFEQLAVMPPLSLIDDADRARVWGQLREAFESHKTVEIAPFRAQRADGTWLWYESTGITYRRADGARRFLAVGRDVTERVRQEEERRAFETRLQQSQRLESLGVLAGGIAHDFNNLLTPIVGESRLALADLPASSPLRERIERILRAAQRAAELTRQMLANAGADRPRAEPVDLSAVVDDLARLVEPDAEQVEIRYELVKGLPSIEGDHAQIGQVVTNLVTNAFEALPPGPAQVVIRTGEVEITQCGPVATTLPFDPPAPGHYVYLEVEDSGCGMDEETRARIFDPFFTTKFTGRGLGLAAVLGIVRAHEGAVEIDTAPTRGTRFRVLFPAAGIA